MPLFGRRLFHHPQDISNENDRKEISRIEHTNEEYQSQEIYQKLLQVYALERWTCECTWRASLTHQEATQSEIETRKKLSPLVSDYFYKPIFDVIHHNVKPLEKLAEEVSTILCQAFVLGEPVQFRKKKDSNTIKGIIERIDDNDDPKKRTSERASVQAKIPSDKQMKNVKYTVRLADEDRTVDHVVASDLQRCHMIPNREKLKVFIRSFAIRLGNRTDSPWIFYDDSKKEKYQIKDRLPLVVIEKFKKSMTITLEEIVREQERIIRKQAEEQSAALQDKTKVNESDGLPLIFTEHFDDIQIILSDDEDLSKLFAETQKNQVKSPTKKSPYKAKKQLTLHEMNFTKKTTNHQDLLDKSTIPTYEIVVPIVLLQKLDKTRRDRGIESKFFQRLVLQCARTLDEKQRLRLPDEYRSLVQIKYDELELKRRLAQMTDEEKKLFFHSRRQQQKPIEDLDLPFSKDLPVPNVIQSSLAICPDSIGHLLMIGTFLTSCHSLFSLSLNDDLPKVTQQYLRSFRLESLLNTSPTNFFNYFLDILQILMKLLFKEDENRSNTDDTDEPKEHQQNDNNNNYEHMDLDRDIEQIYATKLTDIPLTPFTCQELTRLYLLKEKDEHNRSILDKLATCETKDLSITEQIDLLLLLISTITTDNELMSDYFEHLNRMMSEASRERQQLLAERRKAQEEESKQKKIQLQNGDQKQVANIGLLMTPKTSLGKTANDENRQASSPAIINDENGDMDTSVDDDLKSVLQRRRQMVAVSKELKEKRELEAQKQYLQQKRQLVIQKAEQVYQETLVNVQFGFRIKPLGFDRNYNRYWFFRGHPGLLVEKGWIGSDINYSTTITSEDLSSLVLPTETLIPKDEANCWFIYDNETIIQQLVQSLNHRGIREHHLLVNLKKSMPLIHHEFEQMKKSKYSFESPEEEPDIAHDILASFRSELEELETRLRLGSLGGFTSPDHLQPWQSNLQQAKKRVDLGELLVQLQQTVPDKYASGIFSLHEKKFLQIWMKDCRTCQTYSRLYVLMMIFENSITWNKSTVGMKCKICRKKHTDESILVCDQCCHGFHSECLRSSLRTSSNSSNDLWYCPACRPQTISKRRGKQTQPTDDYDMQVDSPSTTSDDDDDDLSASGTDEHSDREENLCCVCEMDNEIFPCTQCQQFYHCQCHQPPLRCPPRSNNWLCNNCRNGISHEISKKSQRKHNSNRRGSRKNDSEAEEDGDEETKCTNQRRSKRLRRSDSNHRKAPASSSSHDQSSTNGNDEESISMELDNENPTNESPSSD